MMIIYSFDSVGVGVDYYPPKMIKVPPQIMTSYNRITNERPAYILPLVNKSGHRLFYRMTS